MTTLTVGEAAASARPATPNRFLAIIRLHFVSPMTTIFLPWMILGFIFLVNLAIWAIIFTSVPTEADRASAQEGLSWSGASFYIFVYMTFVAIQAINLTFPFAQGFGVTRRDFYLGTSVYFVLLSAMFGAGLTVLSLIEDATGGWGLGGHMFTSVYFGVGEWYVRFVLYFAIFAFFLFLGAAFAAVYVRWRANGMIALWAAITVLIVAAIALITFTDSWPAVGTWFAETGANGIILWSLVPTAIAAITGFFIIRRATPRS